MVPQWDLLNLLAEAAQAEPTFTLRRNAEVTELLQEGGRVTGVRFTDRTDGSTHELSAGLTVASDGRDSAVRAAAGLQPPFVRGADGRVVVPPARHTSDPAAGGDHMSPGQFMVMLNRGGGTHPRADAASQRPGTRGCVAPRTAAAIDTDRGAAAHAAPAASIVGNRVGGRPGGCHSRRSGRSRPDGVTTAADAGDAPLPRAPGHPSMAHRNRTAIRTRPAVGSTREFGPRHKSVHD